MNQDQLQKHNNEKSRQNRPQDSLWTLLGDQFTAERKNRMEAVAAGRTGHIRLIIQDIHDPHNIAACMRSAEGLGILNIDVINLYQAFKPSTAAKGAGSWLKIRQWSQVSECVSALREEGYLIAAGMPSQDSISLYDMPVQNKIALLFGNEHQGVAKEWLDHVDIRFTIPMVGMVESFNISVSAALSLADVSRRARLELGDTNYYLSEKEQHPLLGEWASKKIRKSNLVIDEKLRRIAETN